MKVVIKIGLWSILEFDSRLESPSALPGELTGTTSAASPPLRSPSLRPAACPPAAAPRWVPGAGLRPSAAPPLLVSSRERGAGFSPVPPADLLVRACLLHLPEHFLSRSLTSWSVKELTSKACVPRSGTSGAQSRAPGLWWTLTQRQPVPLLVRCWAVSSALPSARLIFVLLLIHKESFSGCHTLLVLCDTFLGGRHRAGFHCSQRFPCLPGRFHELLPR